MKPTRQRRGFLLVSVLAMLVFAGLILSRVASRGVRASLAAKERVELLQRNWALHSCERAVLPEVASTFARLEHAHANRQPDEKSSSDGARPLRKVTKQLMLGGTRVTLTMADESAKLNVNDLLTRRGLVHTDRTLKRVVPPVAQVTQRLRPRNQPQNGSSAFTGWGQIYASNSHEPWLRFVRMASDRLTCWGDSGLNYRRCDPDILKIVLSLEVSKGEADELSELILNNSRIDLSAAMIAKRISPSKRERVKRLLTQNSTCFSLRAEIVGNQRDFTSVSILNVPITMEGEEAPAPTEFIRFLLN